MAETTLTPAVQLVWQIAGDLALRNQELLIEPKHLLYGICSIEKLAVAEGDAWARNLAEAGLIKAEADRLGEIANQHNLNFAAIRRAVRDLTSASPDVAAIAKPHVVSRSPAAHQIFEHAAELASARNSLEIDLLLLLQSVLESKDNAVASITSGSTEALAAVLRHLQALDQQPLGRVVDSSSGLTDLDEEPDVARRPVHITESLDAGDKVASSKERLTWLSEFTWEFGTQGQLELLLQKAAEEMLQMLPTAERDAILISDPTADDLLLKAYRPQKATPRISMTSVRKAMEEKKGFVWRRGEDLTVSQKESNLQTGMYVPLVVNDKSIGVICLDSTVISRQFSSDDLEMVTCFAHQLALAIANYELKASLKQNADILQRLLTNFSPKVRTRLLQRAQMGRLTLGGEHSIVSILCSDIRGFTQLTSSMASDDVVAMLNEYFAALVDCIFRHDGTVDKFVGDAILAVFGSPEADPHHYQNAVKAAVEMQQAMLQVSQSRAARGEITCQVGIGVHAGDVLHGFIGSAERMEFTVIGDAVNLAARYSDGAKGGEILISPEIHQRVWRLIEAEQVSIPTKHEGNFVGYLVKGLCR